MVYSLLPLKSRIALLFQKLNTKRNSSQILMTTRSVHGRFQVDSPSAAGVREERRAEGPGAVLDRKREVRGVHPAGGPHVRRGARRVDAGKSKFV